MKNSPVSSASFGAAIRGPKGHKAHKGHDGAFFGDVTVAGAGFTVDGASAAPEPGVAPEPSSWADDGEDTAVTACPVWLTQLRCARIVSSY